MIRQREILKTIDRFLGSAMVGLFRPPKTIPAYESLSMVRTILVIRPGGMGDAVLLFPLLQAIRRRFPSATIEVLAERRNAEIFNLIPDLVSEVFCYDRIGDFLCILGRRYDAVIDTEQWYRLSAVAARLIRSERRIGFATNERRRLFNVPVAYDQQRYEAENFLALLAGLTGELVSLDPNRPFLTATSAFPGHPLGEPRERAPVTVLIAPGAGYPEKQWGPEKFRQLSEWLVENGYSAGLIGGPADIPLASDIINGLAVQNFAGRTPLRETARLIATAALVIGGDSVALHLAAAFGTPSIALFGPTPPPQWAPRGKGHRTLYHPPPCSPCSRFGHIPPCPYNVECLKRITVEEVFAAIREILPSPVLKPSVR
jgi:ADP-heptose:LPS heptosyltransferase